MGRKVVIFNLELLYFARCTCTKQRDSKAGAAKLEPKHAAKPAFFGRERICACVTLRMTLPSASCTDVRQERSSCGTEARAFIAAANATPEPWLTMSQTSETTLELDPFFRLNCVTRADSARNDNACRACRPQTRSGRARARERFHAGAASASRVCSRGAGPHPHARA